MNFLAVDISKTMTVNTTVEAVNLLTTVAITAGISDFSAGDFVTWDIADGNGLIEVALIYSLSATDSSAGTIVLQRNILAATSDSPYGNIEGSGLGRFDPNDILTKVRTGVGYDFDISYEVQPGNVPSTDYRGEDEFSCILYNSGNAVFPSIVLPSGEPGRMVKLAIFSEKFNTWLETYSALGYDYNEKLDWVYGLRENDEQSEPTFFDENSILRISEGNFNLPNK